MSLSGLTSDQGFTKLGDFGIALNRINTNFSHVFLGCFSSMGLWLLGFGFYLAVELSGNFDLLIY